MEPVFVFVGEDGPAKLAWALKAALEARGLTPARALRTEWGFRIEAKGIVILVYPHPEERGVWGLELRAPRGLSRIFARARLVAAQEALNAVVRHRGPLPASGRGGGATMGP